MKTADEYAELIESYISHGADSGSLAKLAIDVAIAQVYATLAQAAATLEAARLMGPTPEDQACLDELMPKPSFYCSYEWENPGRPLLHQFHRCVSGAHEGHDRPHLCGCGAEL